MRELVRALGRGEVRGVAQPKMAEGVSDVTVGTELEEQDLRPVRADPRKADIEGREERRVAVAASERHVQREAIAGPGAGLIRRTRAREESAAVLVDRHNEHILFPEDRLRSVPVVRVHIENGDAAHALALQRADRYGDVVQETKSRRSIGMRVMQAARRIEGVRHASSGHEPCGEQRAADGDRSAEQHAGVRRRLPAVDEPLAARIQVAQEGEVRRRVDGHELVFARLWCDERRESLMEEARVVE